MGPGFVSREWASCSAAPRRPPTGFNGARLREPGVGDGRYVAISNSDTLQWGPAS